MEAQIVDCGYGTENSSADESADNENVGADANPLNDIKLTDEEYNLLLAELKIEAPVLQEPDYGEIWQLRMIRNLDLMNRISPSIAKQITSINEDHKKLEDPQNWAATCIQKHFRGYLGRKIYTARLYEMFEREEAKRYKKQMEQVEEGEILIENNTLETEIEECILTGKNKFRHLNYCATIIQSAWRRYKDKRDEVANSTEVFIQETSDKERAEQKDVDLIEF
uniref:Unconventional myosin-VI n=1 Tax=Phallusia mammillata TaxID=59560 RepID=A0A6F9DM96_9ASCI|nr:unconventional myosin-VI [Phallusia mammillata]